MVYSAKSDDANTISQFTRRKDIKITTGGTNTPASYQVKITVAYELEMQATFADIRFNTKAGVYIDYWIESKTDSDTADVWLELPDAISDPGSDTIWMYYGNADVSDGGIGVDTFEFFDDFNRADSATVGNGWSEGGNANGEILSNRLRIGTDSTIYRSFDARAHIIDVEMEWSNSYESIIYATGSGANLRGLYAGSRIDSATARIYDSGTTKAEAAHTPIAGTVYRGEFQIASDYATEYRIWKRDTESRPSSATVSYTAFTPANVTQNIGLGSNTGSGNYHYFDNFRVRKYIANEPTSSIGTSQHQRRVVQFI